MSNIYRYAKHITHFQVPQELIPKLTYIKFDELKLLNFLHSEFQRTSKSQVSLQARVISRATGIHPTNLGVARKGLVDEGLLLAERRGMTYLYTCCDPTDRTPISDGTTVSSRINFDDATEPMLLAYFEQRIENCRRTSNGLHGCCPFMGHTDQNPSFSVTTAAGSGGVWNCFGCGKSGKLVDFEVYLSEDATGVTVDRTEAHKRVEAALRSLGLGDSAKSHPSDVVYDYVDSDGVVISQTVRPRGDKTKMYRRRPHPDKPDRYITNLKGCVDLLYRLPEVMKADTVIIVEGEPDVESLRKLNLRDEDYKDVAITTKANGAGGWLSSHSASIRGKKVILIGDTNLKGVQHMDAVQLAIATVASSVNRINLPTEFKDISHWLIGRTAEDFIRLVGGNCLCLPVEI